MEIDNEYCEKHCKGYRDTGGRCFADGRCDAYWKYQKQKGTMIKSNMFYGDPTIKEYRDMEIEKIIEEYLLTKGTWYKSPFKSEKPKQINKEVSAKSLVSSGLFVYGLKDNPTNRRAVEYYCEKWGHIHQIIGENGVIQIPEYLWNRCDEYNRIHTNGNDRKPMED